MLATNITIEDYEERTEKFNIHGCWEWVEGKVVIYELPSMPLETGIGAIVEEIMDACRPAKGTPSRIYSIGSTSKYYVITHCSVCVCIVLIFIF